ncbi:hypothetical protein LTR36_009550 [Oleoguttula mirabilis]|uniref:NmrA-like domain-containing protein n=1 Tax=Oleoguttula mirabilis TaxID=1507867 RepID=A0AAV9JSZ5_9PEZI|nr:hypothetical protein LTR36_009550 [Oleoguttula mirabilis]
MSDSNHLKNVAIVGASGNVGTSALKHLLPTNRFHITIISRSSSTASFPSSPSLTVRKGSYDDSTYLADAFAGQDAVLFALGFMAMGEQSKLIDAAAKAGVKWILPTEYAGDGMNEAMVAAVPIFQPKVQARKQIEELSATYKGLKWIGIATNPWMDFSLRMGLFGINFEKRTAKLYPDAGAFNTSTLEQVGLGISRLLSLPLTDNANPRGSLEHYANNFVYISSFVVTQSQVFEAVRRATGTQERDWQVERSATIEQWIAHAHEAMAKGDRIAGMGLTFAMYMGEGKGGNYQAKALEDMKVLGLQEEDLEAVVTREVEAGPMKTLF